MATETKEPQDSGLGLKEFLGGSNKTDETPKPKVETVAQSEKVDKPDTGKQVEASPKAAEPKGLDKDAKGSDVGEKDKPKLSSEPTDKTKESTAAKTSEGPNWEDDSNPYKKRYTDTHRDWNRVNQERVEAQRQQAELARQIQILHEKFDGTYDEAKWATPPVDPQQVRSWGVLEGKVQASLEAAIRSHGQDTVMQALERYAQIFKDDKGVQERILMSNDPIQGALEALKHHDFFTKFGSTPEAIQKRFEEEFNTTRLPKIQEEIEKKVRAELSKQEREPRGIGQVLGTSSATDKTVAKENAGRPKSLAGIFGR